MRLMLERKGFEQQWNDRVMGCVESVSYKIKLNGTEPEVIWPKRGIRQGIPFHLTCLLFVSSVYILN